MEEITPAEHERLAREQFMQDRWMVGMFGARIVTAEIGFARVELDVNPERHMNSVGAVQGGVLYTLADFAAAIADWRHDQRNCTIDSSMHFVSATKGPKLLACARVERSTRKIGYYHVEITDEFDTLIAVGSYTMFHF